VFFSDKGLHARSERLPGQAYIFRTLNRTEKDLAGLEAHLFVPCTKLDGGM
jgi:hypothetical protein